MINKTLILLVFVLLLAGSFLFWKERMLFIDAPHVLFRIINDGALQITVNRYGSFITQLPPLIAVKLHLPLPAILKIYSVGFICFYLLVIVLLLYKFNKFDLALLLAFYFTLMVSDSYYWPNNEIHQGITWLLFAFSINLFIVERNSSNWPITAIAFIIFFGLAIWTHPLVMVATTYLWVFYWNSGQNWLYSRRQAILFSIILLVLIFLKYRQSAGNWYDGERIDAIKSFSVAKIHVIYQSQTFRFFVKELITTYCILSAIFLCGLFYLLRLKKIFLAVFTALYGLGFVCAVCLTFLYTPPRFYFESEFSVLTIIFSAPFVYYVVPKLKPGITFVILLAVFTSRLLSISAASPVFSNRLSALQDINEKMKAKNIHKLILANDNAHLDSVLIMNWGVPVESMMFSAINDDSPANTFILLQANDIAKFSNVGRDTLIGCYEKRPFSKINSCYFKFDTSSGYKVSDYEKLGSL